MAEKKYEVLDSALHDMSKHAGGFPEGTHDNKFVNEVLKELITYMKSDDTFRCLYKDSVFSGNSYEQLKANRTEEQHVNILFAVPFKAYEVVYFKKQPGFVKIKINCNNLSLKELLSEVPSFDKKLNSWIDKNGYLLRNSFKNWMQGVITKAINCMDRHNTELKQRVSDDGFKIMISKKLQPKEYSINLVPALLFEDWPHPPIRKIYTVVHRTDWTVVPKGPVCEDEPVYWRMSFYNQEEEIMNFSPMLKKVLKLTELLCEHENWKDLHSYAIKTMFLWESENAGGKLHRYGLGDFFMYILQKLSDYLDKSSLPYYWDVKLNLLDHMKKDRIKNLNSRLNVILNNIESNFQKNPHAIKKYFGYNTEEIEENASKIVLNPSSEDVVNSSNISSDTELLSFEDESKKEKGTWGSVLQQTLACDSVEVSEKVSSTTVDLLYRILKEQTEIKQYVQSIAKQHDEMMKEIRDLREDNAQLRKYLSVKTNANYSPFMSAQSCNDFQSSRSLFSNSPNPNPHGSLLLKNMQESVTSSNIPAFESNRVHSVTHGQSLI